MSAIGEITYTTDPTPDADEAVAVFQRSGLKGALADPKVMALLLKSSDILVCARDGGRLVGLARGLTDFLYSCYLSDLVVDAAYQGRGIGRVLVRHLQEAVGPDVHIHLFAAPDARPFYERLGCTRADDCYRMPQPGVYDG